ncbi:hypothetical protein NPIL_543821, partial [Nephila pilipes]
MFRDELRYILGQMTIVSGCGEILNNLDFVVEQQISQTENIKFKESYSLI